MLNLMKHGEHSAWADMVFAKICDVAPALERVIFLAGLSYREYLSSFLLDRGVHVSVPMKGLRIGEQVRWLKLNISLLEL